MNRKSIMVAGTIVLIGLVATVAAHATIVSGLVGQWLFNEGYGIVANDLSGMGNNGTLAGSATFITNDPQKGNVLNVYGVSGEVDYPASSALQPAIGTVSIWVKPTVSKVSDVVRMDTNKLNMCDLAETLYVYDLRITDKGSVVGILANDNPKNCSKAPQRVLSSSANVVKLNQWTHIAMRWDGSTLSVFANGKSVGSTRYTPDSTGLSYSGSNPLKVAAVGWNAANGYLEYVGQLSDLRVYSRALTDTEIHDIAVNGQ